MSPLPWLAPDLYRTRRPASPNPLVRAAHHEDLPNRRFLTPNAGRKLVLPSGAQGRGCAGSSRAGPARREARSGAAERRSGATTGGSARVEGGAQVRGGGARVEGSGMRLSGGAQGRRWHASGRRWTVGWVRLVGWVIFQETEWNRVLYRIGDAQNNILSTGCKIVRSTQRYIITNLLLPLGNISNSLPLALESIM
jgi:hypothetical protein